MKNPVYDPRSEDIIKRLNELGQEQDDPAFLREAKNLVRSANRLYIPSDYSPYPVILGLHFTVSFLYLEMFGARYEIQGRKIMSHRFQIWNGFLKCIVERRHIRLNKRFSINPNGE